MTQRRQRLTVSTEPRWWGDTGWSSGSLWGRPIRPFAPKADH